MELLSFAWSRAAVAGVGKPGPLPLAAEQQVDLGPEQEVERLWST